MDSGFFLKMWVANKVGRKPMFKKMGEVSLAGESRH